jgi:hypothetical protein
MKNCCNISKVDSKKSMMCESLMKKIQKYQAWNDGSFSCFTLQKGKDLITVFGGDTVNLIKKTDLLHCSHFSMD